MRPRIIIHNAVSADGRIDGFMPDIGLFYKLAGAFKEDAILAGSETILAGLEMFGQDEATEPVEKQTGLPLLAVVDSRGRIRAWDRLKGQPYWGEVLVLASESTPVEYLDYLDGQNVSHLVAGKDKVDLAVVLERLSADYTVHTVRVDSGGTLNGALLREGLVDEVSLLTHPVLVGGTSPKSFFVAPDLSSPENAIPLELTHLERLEGGLIWLRYHVLHSPSRPQ